MTEPSPRDRDLLQNLSVLGDLSEDSQAGDRSLEELMTTGESSPSEPKSKLAGELVERWYAELRQIAQAQLRGESTDHTLQPTALVHEAFLRLAKQRNLEEKHRTSMLAAGAKLMRRVLVDHARKRKAIKRGREFSRVLLEDDVQLTLSPQDPIDIVIMDDLIEALAKTSERAARVVEMRFFGGLTTDETAETLEVSPRTVDNDWRFARAWIRRELTQGEVDRASTENSVDSE